MKTIAKFIVAVCFLSAIAAFGIKTTAKPASALENGKSLDKSSENVYFLKRDKL